MSSLPPTRQFEDVEIGEELPELVIELTPTLIVSTAIASRDYQDVHHDHELAKERGSPDIFMNILTTQGICSRYVTDWAGPNAIVTRVRTKLGGPTMPGDTLKIRGKVIAPDGKAVDIGVAGNNAWGNHVTATFTIQLPGRETAFMPTTLHNEAAIAGIGQTAYSKNSGGSELRLATEAVRNAIDDAGIEPSEVDGLVTYTMDSSDEVEVARNVGIGDMTFWSQVNSGGGAAVGLIAHAAMAVATGLAKNVVVYRALNGRSGQRMGQGLSGNVISSDLIHWSWYMPFGLLTPASWIALQARLYMEKYGHPRLRQRHMPFEVDTAARDQWMSCMIQAMADVGIEEEMRQELEAAFFKTADFMRNQPEE